MTIRSSFLALSCVAFTTVAVLGIGGAARAVDATIEELDPSSARAEIAEREGLVLVDLYADW